MSDADFRVILLTHGSDEKIVNSLTAIKSVKIVGIFVETEILRRYSWHEKIRRSVRYDGYYSTLAKLLRRIFSKGGTKRDYQDYLKSSLGRLEKVSKEHSIPIYYVANYHSKEAIELMRSAEADLGIIYGTNILKESVFGIPRLGSINLHQGRVPYYRGGPPVFWELYNDEREVGLTVHFVAAKVDTGEVVLQETVPLVYDYSYGVDFESFILAFRSRLMSRCPHLVARAVQQLVEGTAKTWQQNLEIGFRYRLPVKKEKDELVRRLKKRKRTAPAILIPQGVENRGD